MNRSFERVLLVEGDEEKRLIPHLMAQAGIDWGPKGSEYYNIHVAGSVDELLKPGTIEALLKAPGCQTLGVMLDANDSFQSRIARLRARIPAHYTAKQQDWAADGLVLRERGLPSFGSWIMPDNSSRGMVETFLAYLRPAGKSALDQLAERTAEEAHRLGAPFKEVHRDKARIHTWLAWQDPPGRQLHNAVMENIFSTNHPLLSAFTGWFRRLYQL